MSSLAKDIIAQRIERLILPRPSKCRVIQCWYNALDLNFIMLPCSCCWCGWSSWLGHNTRINSPYNGERWDFIRIFVRFFVRLREGRWRFHIAQGRSRITLKPDILLYTLSFLLIKLFYSPFRTRYYIVKKPQAQDANTEFQVELKALFLRTRNNNEYLFYEVAKQLYPGTNKNTTKGKRLLSKASACFADYRHSLNCMLKQHADRLIQSRRIHT